MIHHATLSIASVNLHILGDKSIRLRPLGISYRRFLQSVRDDFGALDIDVNLELGAMPDTSGMERVFESGVAWSMFRGGSDRYVVLNPPALDTRLWCAHIPEDCSSITVYCGERLREQTGPTISLLNPVSYPLDLVLLTHVLAQRSGVIVHAGGIGLQGKGMVFPGRSGSGKSTLLRQLDGRDDVVVLSDDRVILRSINGAVHVFGTPWLGDAQICENTSVPLDSMLFIRQGKEHAIRKISVSEAAERLLPAVSVPWYDPDPTSAILSFCGEVVQSCNVGELCFAPSPDVVNCLV